ncbi:MAG: DUF488 family protein [Tomitella sp.]|nr:DUF488 family protein [Tomitella sp.]
MGPIDLVRTYDARRGGDEYADITGKDRPALFLIDRVWPRGTSKQALPHDEWIRDVAPSTDLRKWFNHDPDKFDEFAKRYRAELDDNSDAAKPILDAAERGRVVLLYSAKDSEHNQAVVLRQWLKEQ